MLLPFDDELDTDVALFLFAGGVFPPSPISELSCSLISATEGISLGVVRGDTDEVVDRRLPDATIDGEFGSKLLDRLPRGLGFKAKVLRDVDNTVSAVEVSPSVSS